jgi:O-antigen ligase
MTIPAAQQRQVARRASLEWYLRWGVILLLCLTLFVPFVVTDGHVFPDLLFPYVTGKSLVFRIFIELATGLYVLLAWCEPKYLPSASWLKCGACAFVLWGAIAVVTSVDPRKSFWGNIERTDSYLTLLHLFAYFLIAGSVITVEKWWTQFLRISLSASSLMAAYGLLQVIGLVSINQQNDLRIDGTFGNPTFLAVYLLFGVFIALFLIAVDPKLRFARWAYGISVVVQSAALYYTQTRGAILGLGVGLIFAAAFIAWSARAPELRFIRRLSWCMLGALGLLIMVFLAVRDLPIVKRSATLERIASISLEHRTVLPRLRAWGTVWQGFAERPVFGWGQENFNVVVTKFHPAPMDEPNQWYDRAHNQFLDWLIAGGFPMFALYVSLFALAGWAVIVSSLSILARAALVGLLAAYIFNNLLFFDGLICAMYFWLSLAIADSLSPGKPVPLLAQSESVLRGGVAIATPVVVAVLAIGMYMLNAPAYIRAHDLLRWFSPSSQERILNCARVATTAAC